MYNRYIPNGTSYTRVTEEEPHSGRTTVPPGSGQGRETFSPPPPQGGEGSHKKASSWLTGLLKRFQLEDLDSGDILLLLILLFLFIDGDDLELLITLALLILLGLGGKESSDA